MTDEPIKRSGLRFLWQVPDGADWRWHPHIEGAIIVAHPSRPPWIIMPDGTERELMAVVPTPPADSKPE
jgi:hypothetical protein